MSLFKDPLPKQGKVHIYDCSIFNDAKWSVFQEREKSFWRHEVQRPSYAPDPLAHILPSLKNWEIEAEFFKDKSALEVGSGPIAFFSGVDVLNPSYISDNLVISDPLMDFYQELWVAKMLPERAVLLKSPGEDLPFPDNSFDIVVTNNTLDHVQDIEKFLLENTRVLKPGGLFLFSSHVITNLVKPFEPILKIADKNHPYHFTLDEMVSIFKNCGLRMKRHAVVPLYLEEKIPQETNILQKAKYFLGFHILHTLYGVIEKKA
jgi:SAM-dependent methyltransferase